MDSGLRISLLKAIAKILVIDISPLKGYIISDLDDTGGYYGYTNKNSTLIKKLTAATMTYYKGTLADYATDWTNRATLTYVQPHLINW